MKPIVVAILLASSFASIAAEADSNLCEMYGSLARGITEDRDRGVSYNAELGKLKGAAQGLPSSSGILQISKAALKTSYLDMPKLTPEGAYKLFYVSCMTTN